MELLGVLCYRELHLSPFVLGPMIATLEPFFMASTMKRGSPRDC